MLAHAGLLAAAASNAVHPIMHNLSMLALGSKPGKRAAPPSQPARWATHVKGLKMPAVKTFQLAVSLRPTAGSAHISRPITTSIIT